MTTLAEAFGIPIDEANRVAHVTELLALDPPPADFGGPSTELEITQWKMHLSFTAGLHWLLTDPSQARRAFIQTMSMIDEFDPQNSLHTWRSVCAALIDPRPEYLGSIERPSSPILGRKLTAKEVGDFNNLTQQFRELQYRDEHVPPPGEDLDYRKKWEERWWDRTRPLVKDLVHGWGSRLSAVRYFRPGEAPLGRPLVDPLRFALVAAAQREYLRRHARNRSYVPHGASISERAFLSAAAELARAAEFDSSS